MKLKTNTLVQAGAAVAAALAITACGPSTGDKAGGDSSAPSTSSNSEPKKPEAPKTEAAKTESPKTEAPKTEAPKTTASNSTSSGEGEAAAAKAPPGFSEADLVKVEPKYPKPMFQGTPTPTGNLPNLEKPDPEAYKLRETFMVPKGSENVAKGKKVTSSDAIPIIGSLELITDDDADGSDGCYVELSPGKQWVQIDLEADYDIWKLLVWHFHKNTAVYFNVVVQISDDAEFKTGVTTVYNSDTDNVMGFGAGKDKLYVETNHGRLIDAKGAKGRYVRLWSKGNSANEMNHYVEVQVYGSKPK